MCACVFTPGDPTAHAEVVAIRNAGRRSDWDNLVLVSTLRYRRQSSPYAFGQKKLEQKYQEKWSIPTRTR